jgi:hypothetical protein
MKHICLVYFLQVVTVRAKPRGIGLDPADIDQLEVDGAFALAVLSPGPGNPTDFQACIPLGILCMSSINCRVVWPCYSFPCEGLRESGLG